MACVRHRRHDAPGKSADCQYGIGCGGRWVLDWRQPGTGRRRWTEFPYTAEGYEDAQAECLRLRRRARYGLVEPDTRLKWGTWVEKWLREGEWTDPTRENYRDTLRLHFGEFEDRPLCAMTREVLREHLIARRERYAVASRRRMLATARLMLAAAVDAGHLPSNPADGLIRSLKLLRKRGDRSKAIALCDWRPFLLALRGFPAEDQLPYYLMGFTGLRLGEAQGVRLADFDWSSGEAGVLRVVRQVRKDGKIGRPKGGREREVDVAELLRDTIRAILQRRGAIALERGTPDGPWLLAPSWGEVPSAQQARNDRNRIQRTMTRVCKRAKINRYTPHSLRHTYATLLLGTDPDERLLFYVSRQLGHSTVAMTADLYARSARPRAPGVVDRLSALGGVVQASIEFGGPVPIRRRDAS